MATRPRILITNDDGIDAAGLAAVHDALSDVGETTVVAPDAEQSGTWRLRSEEFTVEERERGYAVDGTPCDCVNFGLGALDADFDAVVSGCNPGPNFGAHIVELSGTVGAARQAAFLGVPGVALSLYCHPDGSRDFDREDYAEVEAFARRIVPAIADATDPAGGAESVDPGFDYLNVNVPDEIGADDPVHVTELTYDCDVGVAEGEGCYERRDPFYDPLRSRVDANVVDEKGTDRRAIADEAVSVTPLRVRARHGETAAVSDLLETCDFAGH